MHERTVCSGQTNFYGLTVMQFGIRGKSHTDIFRCITEPVSVFLILGIRSFLQQR